MKVSNCIIISLLFLICATSVAQNNETQVKKRVGKASLISLNNKDHLLLDAGFKIGNRQATIIIDFNGMVLRSLDSLITAPWGNGVRLKDISGYNVEIRRANVNSHNGLMFSSGVKTIAITQEEYDHLKP